MSQRTIESSTSSSARGNWLWRTLYGKLAVTLLGLLSLVGTLFLLANLISTRIFLQEINQGLHRDLAAHLVEESIPLESGEVRTEALEHIFHMLMVINPAIEVTPPARYSRTRLPTTASSAVPSRWRRSATS